MPVGDMTLPVADAQQTDFLEQERLRRLGLYKILRTQSEPAYDSIAGLAANLLEAPIAFLCLTDAKTHWFKARIGFELDEISRSASFCDHTLTGQDVMAVQDASNDARFAGNPLVAGPYHVKFYAGFALRDADGFALGTLAVADVVPRQISEQQKNLLRSLAGIAVDRMELQKVKADLHETITTTEAARQDAVYGPCRTAANHRVPAASHCSSGRAEQSYFVEQEL